jgi:hypothetical protein
MKPKTILIQPLMIHGDGLKSNPQGPGTSRKPPMEMKKEDIDDVVHTTLVLRIESQARETDLLSV